MTRLLGLTTLLLVSMLGPSHATAGNYDYATGEHKGHLQIAFTAHDGPTGVIGQIKLQFDAGRRIRVDVQCLAVDGNLASIQGTIVFTNHPEVLGGRVEVEVEDRGKANPGHQGGPDVAQVNFDDYPDEWTTGIGPDCDPNSGPFNTTVDGNIEVTDNTP